ncbi:MAG TPA: nitroreductase/quinone reductase family protein [Kineosporiaceae bacterium]|nr:nitroreductase/quinone reductase family protein [Kineosporiaceae bacterium]
MTAAHSSPTAPVATGIHCLRTGWWRLASNVYLVESGSSWVLVDAGWPGQAGVIRAAAESLFGRGTRPAAILLTHVHPDHSGAAAELARWWHLPVHVHPAEVPQAAGGIVPGFENPLDRVLVAPVLRLLPRRLLPARDPLADIVRGLDPAGCPPGLPDWRCVPAPGHTPGSLAFFRPADRVMLTGDAVLTIDPNSVGDLLRDRPALGGPPWISTWNWARARESVARLAELEPAVIAAGHGRAMTGSAPELRALAPRMHRPLRASEGFFRGVDYAAPGPYRRPPAAYLRLQRLAHVLTRIGWSPGYVVNLEVPGRRTGVLRRTTLVCTVYEGRSHLVALAGDSDWVRNVRAAGGSVVIGRRERRPAMLVEVPPQDRPPIIRAYSHRPGRSTTAAAREARTYFGFGTHPSEAQVRTAADRYPVFLIQEPNAAAGDPSGPSPATSQPSTPAAPAGRLGTVLLAASAAGAPLSLLALRHLGRWGRVLVASGCAVLLVRDTTMVASGTPRRLRPLPRALLVAEVATSATAVATGVWPWQQDPSTTAHRRHNRGPAPHRRHTREQTAAALLRAAACATMAIHTTRFAIYLSPGSGRRSPSGPEGPSPVAP